MGIKFVEDLGGPLAVTAIDLITETTVPRWNEWAIYGTTLLTGFGVFTGRGGAINQAAFHASIPMTARKIYSRVRTGFGGPVRRLASRGVARYPAAANVPAFGAARLV